MGRQVLGANTKVRFRPHFFPFTEPSVEYDFSCSICGGDDADCSICKGTGWIEIAGAGMVDPAVLEGLGLDPERWSGFAAGLGVERFCMVRHGVDDIRRLYTSDLRFLQQF